MQVSKCTESLTLLCFGSIFHKMYAPLIILHRNISHIGSDDIGEGAVPALQGRAPDFFAKLFSMFLSYEIEILEVI